jgi:hypothetical protein
MIGLRPGVGGTADVTGYGEAMLLAKNSVDSNLYDGWFEIKDISPSTTV